ncbi:MAG: sigma-54 dependent transcriptional regulator [Desulfobacterales bacterium]|jgi:two-component system NtrC family response regulator|nr:sigma-54 dependent transcriptional regulator [Desulfobacterales bacterium]
METILVVDDEKNYLLVLSALLEEEGYEVLTALSGPEAIEIQKASDIDLVLTDMKMPTMDGIDLLERIKACDPDVPVIIMTAHGTVDKAVEAMQKGAYTYILKPFDNDRLILYVQKAMALFQVVKENRRLRSVVESQYRFGNIIGKSKAMRDVFDTIQKVAPSNASVLIEGESGTGKELVAKAIHFNSPRRDLPFVAVNCSALAEGLLESELFGHEKGAFTGAVASKKGRFELAHGGTLFLDEIGELSANLQVKLLRVLQEKVFERVGGVRPITVDIRVIAATNKHLKEEMQAGRFREDLYYRLDVVHIIIPPLRERGEDIRLLVDHFIAKYAGERKLSAPVKGVTQEVDRLFYEYTWPGNVRELENVIERAMILCPTDIISDRDLPKGFRSSIDNALHLDGIPASAGLYETLEMVEKQMIQRALRMADHVQAHAADLLGIAKSGLSQKIKKYNLEVRPKG